MGCNCDKDNLAISDGITNTNISQNCNNIQTPPNKEHNTNEFIQNRIKARMQNNQRRKSVSISMNSVDTSFTRQKSRSMSTFGAITPSDPIEIINNSKKAYKYLPSIGHKKGEMKEKISDLKKLWEESKKSGEMTVTTNKRNLNFK